MSTRRIFQDARLDPGELVSIAFSRPVSISRLRVEQVIPVYRDAPRSEKQNGCIIHLLPCLVGVRARLQPTRLSKHVLIDS
jgi:hypothetical protein